MDEEIFARRPLGVDMLLPAAYGVVRLREVWLGRDRLGYVDCAHTTIQCITQSGHGDNRRADLDMPCWSY